MPSIYIGKTGIIHEVLRSKIPHLKNLAEPSDPLERRFLFTGPPGLAKTDLARQFALELAGAGGRSDLNLDFYMGTAVNVEVIRDWVRNACYRPLWGDLTIRFIDEIDTTPPAAVTELRGYLDTLPRSVIFLATTNKLVKDLAEPLQTRFKIWKFEPVQAPVLAAFLQTRFPQLAADTLHSIAAKAMGNVRAALIDADSEADVARYRQLAAA